MARRLASIALCALAAALLMAPSAWATDPTLSGSFDASSPTPFTPQRMAVNETTGNVYVIDTANGTVDVFSSDGSTLVSQMDGRNTTAGSFSFGGDDDIAIDNTSGPNRGNIYINSENAGLVFAFDSAGSFLWQSNANVSDACGVAVDPQGNPWLGDFNHGLQKLDPSSGAAVGSAILQTGDSCHFAFDAAGNVLLNHWNTRVDKYDPSGTLITTIDRLGNRDVAIDGVSGAIYTDAQDTVSIYGGSGDLVSQFGAGVDFTTSTGVAINGALRKIYVSDSSAGRVLIYDALPLHTLTVSPSGAGTGTVDSDAGAITGCSNGGGTCVGSYDQGMTVHLHATDGAHSTFSDWTGCDSSTGSDCAVAVNADTTVTPTFDLVRHTLNVSTDGTGSGSVTSSPAGIDCGATCSSLFDEGTSVTLTAAPAAHSAFAGWVGCDSVSGDRCTVGMAADANVRATFTKLQHTVTASKAGDGSGTVTSSPAGISCGATCSALFDEGASVTLTAAADSGSTFAGWSGGGCSGTGTCIVSVGADASVTATFTKNAPSTCPQDLSKCPTPFLTLGGFSSKTLLLRLTCHGVAGQPACSGKLTFKAVIKVRVKHGKKKKLVKKTIVVATGSYNVAAGGSGSVKLKLTSAAKTALKRGPLTARCTNPNGSIHLPKTKVKKKKKRH